MDSFMMDPIVAALEAGDPLSAGRLCRERLRQMPDDADLQVLVAVNLGHQGRRAEALDIYARLTQLHPEDSMHWRNYAAALRNVGDLDGSEQAFATAVRFAPDDAELLELYGLVQVDLGKRIEARNTLLRAFGKAPESPAIRIHAALACLACRDLRAENLLRPWREWLPLDDSLESELAEALAQHADVSGAVELLEDLALRLPGQRRIRLRLAGLYERVNRLDEAEALLKQVEAEFAVADQDAVEAREIADQHARLAARRRDHANTREILERLGPRGDRDYAYWFELAQACDKTGEMAAAMAALERAHSLQVAEIREVHPDWFEPGAKVLPNQNEIVQASDFATWPVLRAPDASQSPVFVMGFPRSGTTLLEQMLDAHPRLQSMDERPFFNMLAGQLENSTGFQVPRDLGRLSQRDC